MKTKKMVMVALMTTFALILSYIESLIPFFAGVPGMKLGLANMSVVVILYLYDYKQAILVNLIRILLSSLLFGNLFSFAFSICGALVSFIIMIIAKKLKLSIYGVSISGGVFHNLAQIFVAMVIVKNYAVQYYVPILIISGVLTGYLIGVISNQVLKRVIKQVR